MKKLLVLLIMIMTLSACTEEPVLEDFTVTFYVDGEVVKEVTVEEDSMVSVPEAPVVEGYEFEGWYLDDSFTALFNFASPVVGSLQLHGKLNPGEYTLKIVDVDGTILLQDDFEYNSGLDSVVVNEPVREGYTFDGWDSAIPETMPNQDVLITATYVINTYSVSYLDYDGTVLGTEDFDYGETISSVPPTDPVREGYEFTGWSGVLPNTMPNEDLVINALYDVNTFIMTFLNYDGTFLSMQEFDYGESFDNIEKPTPSDREGYTFDGWDTSLTVLNVTDNVVVTAVYTINMYNLIYQDNDGTALQTFEFTFGEAIAVSVDDPIKEGHAFIDWDMETPATMPSSDVYITAQYIGERVESNATGDPSDYFGIQTHTAGDYIIVASHAPNNWTGKIWIYKYSDPDYSREIVGVNATEGSYFGENVLIHGDYLVVRSIKDNNYTGSIWIYKLSDDTYERQIIGYDSEEGDNFAVNVVLHEDYIISLSFTDNDTYTGSVYIYKFSDDTYERKIIGLGATSNSRFGQLINPVGDYLFVGSFYHNMATGRVWMYKFSDDTYERVIDSSAAAQQNYFGRTIEVSGDYVAVGSDGMQTSRGSVWVYKISDPTYERMIIGTGLGTYENFGMWLDVKDDYLIVPAPKTNGYRGAIYLYKFSDPTYERIITGLNTSSDDWFGFSYIIEDDYILVPSSNYNSNQGAVWIYKFSDDQYERQIIGSLTVTDSRFASTLVIEEDYIIVGSGSFNSGEGAVWVYKFSDADYDRMIRWIDTTPSKNFGGYIQVFNGLLLISNQYSFENDGMVGIYQLDDEDFVLKLSGAAPDDNQYYGAYECIVSDDYFIVPNFGFDERRGKIYIYSFD